MSGHVLENVGPSNSLLAAGNVDGTAVDDICAILELERAHYLPCYDYLSHNQAYEGTGKYVDESCRRKMSEWSYNFVDHFKFDREVVSVTMNYLDRMSVSTAIKTKGPVTTDEYQLTAVAALYLAVKLHGETDAVEGGPRKQPIKTYVQLCRGLFTVETIGAKEREILSTLDWHVNPPSTICFIASFLRFLPDSWGCKPLDASVANAIFETARYIAELSVCISSFAFQFKNSEIAYAVILCSVDAIQHKIPLPYAARLAFQDNVAAATSLTPNTRSIIRLSIMLKSLDEFPYKFDQTDLPEPVGTLSRSSSIGSEDGTTSPVCVCEPLDLIREQKRTRLTYE